MRRRHLNVLVLTQDAANHFAGLGLPRSNCRLTGFQLCRGAAPIIKAQSRLSLSIVGPVTCDTSVGQNRPNHPIEINTLPQQGGVQVNKPHQGNADDQTRKTHITTDC